MKVPFSWLTSICDPGMDPSRLAERLAMTGTEVERVVSSGVSDPTGLVIGETIAVEPHPNADRLMVCRVADGKGERTIVCGAPNVAAGQRVVVALPGAVLPGGQEIGAATLRGVESEGMICGEDELGLGSESDGIMVLEGEIPAGTPAAEVLPLSESVLELEVTPNRPDCLGIYGVAREVHAVTGAPLAPPPWDGWEDPGSGQVDAVVSVEIEDPAICPRFTARAFTGVEVGPSPAWLSQRLLSAGQRPVNNVVDVTNYVMLLTGQPLHAFDLEKVPGGELTVRTARDSETVTTLDGVTRELEPGTPLVCDRNGPTAIAGIMGGAGSEVRTGTDSVLLEVATWDGPTILRASRRLGLRSEASNRFEKGLHPALASHAQAVASALLVELCGATELSGMVDRGDGVPGPEGIFLRDSTVDSVLGMEVPRAEQAASLERLGFAVRPLDDGLEVEVPPERAFDVTREIDLVEEIARVDDLDRNLPATLPGTTGGGGGLSRGQTIRRRVEDATCEAGFDETVSYSFVAPGAIERLGFDREDPRGRPVELSNPLSEDQSVMRTSLLVSLLEAAAANRDRGFRDIRLFECGRIYLPATGPEAGAAFPGDRPAPASEPLTFGLLAVGELVPSGWKGSAVKADFFSVKAVIEQVFGSVGAELEVVPGAEPFLHPGKAGSVEVEGRPVGWIGELHPAVASALGLDGAVAAELSLEPIVSATTSGREEFTEIPSRPAVERDLAAVLPITVSAAEAEGALRSAGGELLEDVSLFDVYEGDQVPDGHRSLAFRVRFRADDRTLVEEEVEPAWEAMGTAVQTLGGSLRG